MDVTESEPVQEEHWVCDLVKKVNDRAAHFAVALLYGKDAYKVPGYVCLSVFLSEFVCFSQLCA
jgi:hypothetical protein